MININFKNFPRLPNWVIAVLLVVLVVLVGLLIYNAILVWEVVADGRGVDIWGLKITEGNRELKTTNQILKKKILELEHLTNQIPELEFMITSNKRKISSQSNNINKLNTRIATLKQNNKIKFDKIEEYENILKHLTNLGNVEAVIVYEIDNTFAKKITIADLKKELREYSKEKVNDSLDGLRNKNIIVGNPAKTNLVSLTSLGKSVAEKIRWAFNR